MPVNMEMKELGFSKEFPNLHESTIRNLKRSYFFMLKEESKKVKPVVISFLPSKSMGHATTIVRVRWQINSSFKTNQKQGWCPIYPRLTCYCGGTYQE